MARTEARIKTARWNDDDWCNLTVGAQWLYDLILTQADLSMCGVVGFMPQRWAKKAKGMTQAKVMAFLDELVEARFVVLDRSTEEVWVRTFTRHDGVIDAPGPAVGMMKDYPGIMSKPIREGFMEGLGEGFMEGLVERFPKWFREPIAERFPKPFTKAFREHFGGPFPKPFVDGSNARVGARVAPSPSPSPSPGPSAEPIPESTTHSNGKVKDDRISQQSKTEEPEPPPLPPRAIPLIDRWLGIVENGTRPYQRADAERMIVHLLDHLDADIIDERIGSCALEAEAGNPPGRAKYLLVACRRWAGQHNITIPDPTVGAAK